jgi:hypothetical protein
MKNLSYRIQQVMLMEKSLNNRIAAYALAHRSDIKWKRRLYAIQYGMSVFSILRGGADRP